jgi:hypothetical protein
MKRASIQLLTMLSIAMAIEFHLTSLAMKVV